MIVWLDTYTFHFNIKILQLYFLLSWKTCFLSISFSFFLFHSSLGLCAPVNTQTSVTAGWGRLQSKPNASACLNVYDWLTPRDPNIAALIQVCIERLLFVPYILLFGFLLFSSARYLYSSPRAMEAFFMGLKGNYSQSPQGSDKVVGFLSPLCLGFCSEP